MSKKNWIMVKRGLSEDPKHRETMGEAVWAYLHMIDHADFETGIVHGWTDESVAAEMSMASSRTLRDWRKRLENGNYISCRRTQHGFDITILKWVNPHSYSGRVFNTPTGGQAQNNQSDIHMSVSDVQIDTQIDTQISSENVSSSYSPIPIPPPMGGLTEKELQQANDKVDFMISSQRKFKYTNRDKIPVPYLDFADVYNELTGQEPTKRIIQDWLMTFSEWQNENLAVNDIREAYRYANRPEGGFIVARPGSLTNTAVAFRSKRLSRRTVFETKADETKETLRAIDEARSKAVPMPDFVREKFGKLIKKMEISE